VNASTDLRLHVSDAIGEVSARLIRPPDAWLLYVMAHGAGAGMLHRFLENMSLALASEGIATLRFQFPYLEASRRRPDPPSVLEATVRAAVARAGELAPELPLVAGGKSLGGRMTSGAAAAEPLPKVRGLVFLGFPLHPPGQPGTHRADHLHHLDLPMLFLQGTRDTFARLDLITDLCHGLGSRATLQLVDGADHSFGIPRSAGRTSGEVLSELVSSVSRWARAVAVDSVSA
jgi:uncharacterized protein